MIPATGLSLSTQCRALVGAVLALVPVVLPCAFAPRRAPTKSDSLLLAMPHELIENPALGEEAGAVWLLERSCPSLLRRAPGGGILPGLARKWSVVTRYTVRIVPGSRIPDGTTTSAGALFTYLSMTRRGAALSALSSIEAVGPDRVRLTTAQPAFGVIEALFEICPKSFDRAGLVIEQEVTLHLGSAGRNLFRDIMVTEEVHKKLGRRSPYGGLFAEIDRYTLNGSTLVAVSSKESYAALEAWTCPLIGHRRGPGEFLPELVRKRLRVEDARDVDELPGRLRRGDLGAAFTAGPLSGISGIDLGRPVVVAALFRSDVSLSRRQALARAARGDRVALAPFSLSILCTASDEPARLEAERLAQAWRNSAIQTRLEVLEGRPYADRIARRQFEVLVASFPEGLLSDPRRWWHSSEAAGGGNWAGLTDADGDRLIDALGRMFDADARQAQLRRIYAHLVDKSALIVLRETTLHLSGDWGELFFVPTNP